MLVDRARVRVTAGAGGNGCTSFRREKYVPRGGPDGGDGGDGGNIYFVARERASSLVDIKYHSTWIGKSGQHGGGQNKHGKTGADTYIEIPLGTVIRDWPSGDVVGELVEEGRQFLAAAGGRGGKGNARFASSTRRAPHFAEKGEPGGEAEYLLELKLIADVGIVGKPNAGKSSLLSRVSAARPEIADYPFTTLSPKLGVVELPGARRLTVADIPGLIEGAAEGRGLGLDFLRHIERTKILLFLIDLGDPDPAATRRLLDNELAEYSETLPEKPRIYALNKADVPENRARFAAIAPEFGEPFLISAVTGEGTEKLLEALWRAVEEARREESAEAALETGEAAETIRYEPPYTIHREGEGFRIEGQKVVRAVRMTNFDNEEAVNHLQERLKRMGVFKALKRMGAQTGQPIYVGEVKLEYQLD
ncbi:MAG: GTPase ObgE [Candidatus Hydrogenedentota bacterium]